MGEYATVKMPNMRPLNVGDIYAKPGNEHIFRVIGPDNLVQRFTGNRAERRETLAEWRRAQGLARRL